MAVDLPESLEAARTELQQLGAFLQSVEQVKARFAFLSGWLAAQGDDPEAAMNGNGNGAQGTVTHTTNGTPNRAQRRRKVAP
jgi:hypothetical protein